MKNFHLHTNMSDGTDSPLELLAKVVESGCDAFSITDHDDLRANKIILEYLEANPSPVRFFTGVEMTSTFKGVDMHLLCHGFNIAHQSVAQLIEESACLRKKRISTLIKELPRVHGITIPKEDRCSILECEVPSSAQIAKSLRKLGVEGSIKELLKQYLSFLDDSDFAVDATDVIKAFTLAGGLVTVAHPIEIQEDHNIGVEELKNILKELKNIGLSGMEVFHNSHGPQEIENYTNIAKELNLLVSCGSDYHGRNKKNVELMQFSNFGFVPDDEQITIYQALSNKND